MKTITLYLFIILVFSAGAHSNMVIDENQSKIKIFESQTDMKGWNSVVKGIILSFKAGDNVDKNDLSQSKHIKSQATIRLYNKNGIDRGTTLYIVNNNNLVVAKMSVKTIVNTRAFGYLAIGYGNMILAGEGDRAVIKIFDEYSQYAYIHKSRGDYYKAIDDTSKAIVEYKKAIELDSGNPEAHLELGYVYFNKGVYNFAYKEFHESYKNINRLYDNEDKYQLLKGLTELRYKEVFYSYLNQQMKNKYREEGIRYGKEALKVYPDSIEINFYMGMFFYKNPEDHDTEARDHFLKVLDINPEHIDASIALSELYLKHKNKPKARKYAENARKIDPGNRRARELMKYIDEYK